MRVLAVAIAVFALSGPARAGGPALDAYAAGDFMAAATLAESGGRDHALAARALIAEAVTADGADVDALIARAEQNARAGVAARAGDLEAKLQLALALGLKARRATLQQAVRHGYAREGRDLIDDALRQSPRSAWAHALDGAWHLEILRRGGGAGAALYGARREAGIAAFERARALAPYDAAIAYQYAVALLELDGARSSGKVRALLAEAGGFDPQDAFEAAITSEAQRIARVLDAEGVDAAARAAAGRMG